MTAIVWFRRDLRIHDHPALGGAIDGGERVTPVFCFDERLLSGRHASGPRTQFMLESLADLHSALRERGSGLVVRFGIPERELLDLAAEVEADSVHFSADAGGFARRRDTRVVRRLREAGVEPVMYAGTFTVANLVSVQTKAGSVYTCLRRSTGSGARRRGVNWYRRRAGCRRCRLSFDAVRCRSWRTSAWSRSARIRRRAASRPAERR